MTEWFTLFNGLLFAGFGILNYSLGHSRAATYVAGFAAAFVVAGLTARVGYLRWLCPVVWLGLLLEFLLNAPAGLMDGGIVTLPIMIYLTAGVALSWHFSRREREE